MRALCVFLHSLVRLCAVLCIYLMFLADGIVQKQIGYLYYAHIFSYCNSCLGTNLHFQNRHCSRTDCIRKYKSVFFFSIVVWENNFPK